jgi:hypothetical protein
MVIEEELKFKEKMGSGFSQIPHVGSELNEI